MKLLVPSAILAAAIALLAADTAVLWKDPGPVESLDLAGGPGGRSKAPKAPFKFVEEEARGTAPKVVVRDARGAVWMVKFGPEVKAETFATRIVWAARYPAEPTYYVPDGNIEGAGSLGRAAQFIDRNGRFREARFELRDNQSYSVVPDVRWSLDEKTLKGTKELSGLKLAIMLVANWDIKPENFALVTIGGQRYYAITDWGASMGRAGDFSYRSKWDCAAYTQQSEHFVDGVDNGYVAFHYTGKAANIITNNIKVDDVKWFAARMGKLSDAQIRSALESSGATPAEANCFAAAFRKRLDQLSAAASGKLGDSVTRTRTVTTTTRTVTTPEP